MKYTKSLYIFLPDLSFGGVQQLCLKLIEGFLSKHIKVSVICLRCTGEYTNKFKNLNVEIITVSSIRKYISLMIELNRKKSKILFLPSYHAAIFSFPTILFYRNVKLFFVFDRKLSSYKKSTNWYGKLYYFLLVILSYRAEAYIFSYKRALKDFRLSRYFKKLSSTNIYHPVSNSFFSYSSVEKNNSLLYAGRLSEEKGVDGLIDAMYYLKNQYSFTPSLIILGDGNLLHSLQKKVNDLNLNNVKFLGYQDDVAIFMEQSRLFILPSLSEGCSGVLKECLVKGLPAVVTDVDTEGPQEMIGHGSYGEVANVNDYKDLAEKVRIGLDKKYDENYRHKMIEVLSVDKVTESYIKRIFQ